MAFALLTQPSRFEFQCYLVWEWPQMNKIKCRNRFSWFECPAKGPSWRCISKKWTCKIKKTFFRCRCTTSLSAIVTRTASCCRSSISSRRSTWLKPRRPGSSSDHPNIWNPNNMGSSWREDVVRWERMSKIVLPSFQVMFESITVDNYLGHVLPPRDWIICCNLQMFITGKIPRLKLEASA